MDFKVLNNKAKVKAYKHRNLKTLTFVSKDKSVFEHTETNTNKE